MGEQSVADSVDPRALRILLDRYWTSSGWRSDNSAATSPEDFEFAKRASMMFDDVRLSHDDIVDRALTAVRTTNRRVVANAFVASLTSHRRDLRSALGSFAVLQHFPRHRMTPGDGPCEICGEHDRRDTLQDLNVLNFERFKWGGVRHLDPSYAAFDLDLFHRLAPAQPTADDVELLRKLLRAILAAPRMTTSATLHEHLAKIIKSNKSERDVLIAILGLCDILSTPKHRGFARAFVPESEREEPMRRFVDMPYPACWWQRRDGINKKAVAYWFGHLL
jgi:hypothetical protein